MKLAPVYVVYITLVGEKNVLYYNFLSLFFNHILNKLKDAMSVSFRSELFTSYILTMFKQWNLLKYEKFTNIVIHACKILKGKFVENAWHANSALFIYGSTHCVETVK